MPTVNRQAIVPYHPAEMYQLVNDVERYPEFLPWCLASEVLSADETSMRASLTLGQVGLRKTFTTQNTLLKDKEIRLELVDGPFDKLHGRWLFQSITDRGCQVSLHLEFEFNRALLQQTFSTLFTKANERLVEAFCQRAESIYGKRSLF